MLWEQMVVLWNCSLVKWRDVLKWNVGNGVDRYLKTLKGCAVKVKVFPSIAQNSDPGGFELIPFHPESSVQTIR